MDYSLRALECFQAVAETLSFTRAAQRLHLAQPPLSRHIRTLEEKLGTRLFTREGRKVSLTPAGALFMQETHGVLRQLGQAADATRRFAAGENARLQFGFVSAVLHPRLVHTLRRFRQTHRGVQVRVHDDIPARLIQEVRAGALDGAFVGLANEQDSQGIRHVPWLKEDLVACVPFDHPLARRKDCQLRELAHEPFVAVAHEAAPAFANHLRRLCGDAGFRPRIILESPRAQAVAVMVAAGVGIALLPRSAMQLPGQAVVQVPFRKPLTITHVFARRDGTPSPELKKFLSVLASGPGEAASP